MIIDKYWQNGFLKIGDGITINGEDLKVVSDTTGQDLVRLPIHYQPNTLIEVEIDARVLQDGTQALLTVEGFSDISGVENRKIFNTLYIKSKDFQSYKIQALIPPFTNSKWIFVTLGFEHEKAGQVIYKNLKVNVKAPNQPQLIACGMINKSSDNTVKLDSTFPCLGVKNVSFNTPNSIKIFFDANIKPERKPIIVTTLYSDNQNIIPKTLYNVGGDVNDSSVHIRFTDGTQEVSLIDKAISVQFIAYI